MTTKRTIKKAIDETSSSPIKRASVEDSESRAVSRTSVSSAADSLPGDPRIETTAAADAAAEPVPNVQAEANHASVAPEDVRDASVADPK